MDAAGPRAEAGPDLSIKAPQVFVSYARPDREVARRLQSLLESEGWTVWWDQDLYAGASWRSTLTGVLSSVQAVVVLWSKSAARSRWVRREAEVAVERGSFVPCTLDDERPPPPFDEFQAARLTNWSGDPNHQMLPILFAGLERLARPLRLADVRPGYDATFLGTEVSLPIIPGVGDEYPYLHFSVVMNPGRRLAWYVAYNIEPSVSGWERLDQWMADPTLSQVFQPSNEHFFRTEFDRGHLISPMSVAWGKGRAPQIAVRQSYFWTNTAPQTRVLNARTWSAVERAERELATSHGRVAGFSGPVLDDADPWHVVTDEVRGRLRARRTFRLPRRFWKLAAWSTGRRRLNCTAWLLANDHTLTVEPCTVADVERLTGIEFPAPIRRARTVQIPAA